MTRYLKDGEEFHFPSDFGFHGSNDGNDRKGRNKPAIAPLPEHEGDGTLVSERVAKAKGGRVRHYDQGGAVNGVPFPAGGPQGGGMPPGGPMGQPQIGAAGGAPTARGWGPPPQGGMGGQPPGGGQGGQPPQMPQGGQRPPMMGAPGGMPPGGGPSPQAAAAMAHGGRVGKRHYADGGNVVPGGDVNDDAAKADYRRDDKSVRGIPEYARGGRHHYDQGGDVEGDSPMENATVSLPAQDAAKLARNLVSTGRAQGQAEGAQRALAYAQRGMGQAAREGRIAQPRPQPPVETPLQGVPGARGLGQPTPNGPPVTGTLPLAASQGAHAITGPRPPGGITAADGGFIKGAVKHPGRMQEGAKREGVSTHRYMEEHEGSKGSLGAAARLGLRLTGGDLAPHRKK